MYTYTLEILADKTIDELRFLVNQSGLRPKGDRRKRKSYTNALLGSPLPLFASLAFTVVEQELPNELPNDLGNLPVTFSDSFLRKFSPPMSQRVYFFDEDGNALGLWAYSQVDCEAPDPDDFPDISDFWIAMNAWNAENDPPLLADLDSLVVWAPCPWEWYEPEPKPEPEPEIPRRCPCGAVPALQCDGDWATVILVDRTVRVPCYKDTLIGGPRPPPKVGKVR